MRSAIWKISNDQLEQKTLLPTQNHGHDIKQTTFHTTDSNKALSIIDNHFIVWDMGEAEAKVIIDNVCFYNDGFKLFHTFSRKIFC